MIIGGYGIAMENAKWDVEIVKGLQDLVGSMPEQDEYGLRREADELLNNVMQDIVKRGLGEGRLMTEIQLVIGIDFGTHAADSHMRAPMRAPSLRVIRKLACTGTGLRHTGSHISRPVPRCCGQSLVKSLPMATEPALNMRIGAGRVRRVRYSSKRTSS